MLLLWLCYLMGLAPNFQVVFWTCIWDLLLFVFQSHRTFHVEDATRTQHLSQWMTWTSHYQVPVNLMALPCQKTLEQTCVAIGKQVQQVRKSWNFEWAGIVLASQLLGSCSKNIVPPQIKHDDVIETQSMNCMRCQMVHATTLINTPQQTMVFSSNAETLQNISYLRLGGMTIWFSWLWQFLLNGSLFASFSGKTVPFASIWLRAHGNSDWWPCGFDPFAVIANL